MAISACVISLSLDMLASAETVGRKGWMASRLESVIGSLDADRLLRWAKPFLIGASLPHNKGAPPSANASAANAQKWTVLQDGQGVPLGVRLESAFLAEVMLPDATLEQVRFPPQKVDSGNNRNG